MTTVVIYCDGPTRAPHPKFIVAAYRRPHPGLWEALDWWDGHRLPRREHNGDNPEYVLELVLTLRCKCNLGTDLPGDKYLGPLYAALDDAAGAGEVNLVALLVTMADLAG